MSAEKRHHTFKAGLPSKEQLKQQVIDKCMSRIKARRSELMSKYRENNNNAPERAALMTNLLQESLADIQQHSQGSSQHFTASFVMQPPDSTHQRVPEFSEFAKAELHADDDGRILDIAYRDYNNIADGNCNNSSSSSNKKDNYHEDKNWRASSSSSVLDFNTIFDAEEYVELMLQMEQAVQHELDAEIEAEQRQRQILAFNSSNTSSSNRYLSPAGKYASTYGQDTDYYLETDEIYYDEDEYVICPVCRCEPLSISVEGDMAMCNCGANFSMLGSVSSSSSSSSGGGGGGGSICMQQQQQQRQRFLTPTELTQRLSSIFDSHAIVCSGTAVIPTTTTTTTKGAAADNNTNNACIGTGNGHANTLLHFHCFNNRLEAHCSICGFHICGL